MNDIDWLNETSDWFSVPGAPNVDENTTHNRDCATERYAAMKPWLDANIKGRWRLYGVGELDDNLRFIRCTFELRFESREDAAMFRLTWC